MLNVYVTFLTFPFVPSLNFLLLLVNLIFKEDKETILSRSEFNYRFGTGQNKIEKSMQSILSNLVAS